MTPSEDSDPPVPLMAYGAGALAFLAALSIGNQTPQGSDLERVGAYIASGLCVLGACIALGLASVTAALLRR